MMQTEYRSLRTGDEGFLPATEESESYISVGDPVEEIED